jgi:hypothetical protein
MYQTDPASYPLDSGLKKPQREADLSPPSSRTIEVKMYKSHFHTLPYIFMGWYGLPLPCSCGSAANISLSHSVQMGQLKRRTVDKSPS